MNEHEFYNEYDKLTEQQKDFIDAEISRIRAHDYDCENVDWDSLLKDAKHYYPAE